MPPVFSRLVVSSVDYVQKPRRYVSVLVSLKAQLPTLYILTVAFMSAQYSTNNSMPKGKKNALLITPEKCGKAALDFSAQLCKSVECEAPRRRWVNTLWYKHHILSVERQQCDAHKMRNAGADNTDMLAGHTFSPFPAALTPAHTLTVRPRPPAARRGAALQL